MSELVRAPVATVDWLPPRVVLRRRVIDAAVRVFERAGFGEVVTPTFEDTALFKRTSGDASDVVSKEMYSFRDRGDRELTLRPEGTAPVVRAYLEHGLAREPQPVKLWYVAPMFRYARAQRGRYREHWQFGVESLGSDDPAVDAEVIALQAAWFGELGLLDGLELQLNSIGDPTCRPAYRSLLVAYLERFRSELSEDSRGAARDQPAAHLRFQGRGRSEDRERRPAHHRPPLRRPAPSTSRACAPSSTRAACATSSRPSWCGASTTTSAPPGSGCCPRAARRRARSRAAAATTGWREQIGGERVPGVGFGCGTERVVLALEARRRRARRSASWTGSAPARTTRRDRPSTR